MAKHVWVNILETGFLCYTLYQRIYIIAIKSQIVQKIKKILYFFYKSPKKVPKSYQILP